MLVSLTLIAFAMIALRRFGHGLWLSWLIALSIIGFILLSSVDLGMTLITGEGVNGAVFYHMKTGLKGGDVTQYAWPAAGALAVLSAVLAALWRGRRVLRPGAARRSRVVDAGVAVVAVGALVVHPVSLASAQYALRFSLVPQLSEGFVEPARDTAGPQTPRNLVILYLESVERTYMDPDLFPGLTPNLARLEDRALSFTDVGQTTGADFTIGGMVASQCGVPLILSGGANSMRVSRFLGGATCLGDVLHDAGYTLSYLGGASTEFAGKGAFYRSHGYDEVTGLDELLPGLPDPDYRAEWGLQDDTTFDLARARFDNLSSADAPFVLTLLTLDTHHPNGHADTNRACEGLTYGDGSNPMLNSVHCADRMAGAFVDDILSGPHATDTVIAVMSDHLAMVNSATERLEKAPRRNLLMLIDGETAQAPKRIDRPATTLDIAPTILGHLGFDVPGMGLGTNLAGTGSTLPERLGVPVDDRRALDTHVMGFQSVYTRLWAFPDLSDGLYVNAERGEVNFGYSAFRTPVLLSFDEDRTVTGATLGDARADETLSEAALHLAEDTLYLWVDRCAALDLDDRDANRAGNLCALAGRRGGAIRLHPFPGSGFHSADDLKTLLSPTTDVSDSGGDTGLIERIGRTRGDLPLTVSVTGLATGARGVLVQSSAFGAGASFIRRQTTDTLKSGEDWILGRGVTLAGITADGRAEVLDRLDQCDPAFDATTHKPWAARIEAGADTFVAHVVTVHDTAFCGTSIASLDAPLAGLDLPDLRAAGMREAYAAVIDRAGTVEEFPNRAFDRVKLFLEPGAGDAPAVDLRVAAEEVQRTPIAAARAVTVAAIQPTPSPAAPTVCIAPTDVDGRTARAGLVTGSRLSGSALTDVVTFTSGWWGEEQAGRWSGTVDATLEITLPREEGPSDLILGLAAPGGQTRSVRIEHDGRVLAERLFSGTAEVAVPVDDLPRDRRVALTLAVDAADLDCPALRASGSDPRRLGVMLQSLALGAGREAPAPFTRSIAHGGGRLGGAAITDSFEAIGANLSRFDVFEIDLTWTSDDRLVCLHDWQDSFSSRFGFATDAPLPHDEFSRLLAASPERPRNCDLDGLAGWMRANRDVRIVTDVKDRAPEAHAMIAKRHPDLLAQFVPQAYQPEEIDLYRGLGFADVIWTLYRYGDDPASVLEEMTARAPTAITMPVTMAETGLLAAVRARSDIPVYVHTVNAPDAAACLLAAGATGIYSDDLGSDAVARLGRAPEACPATRDS